MYSPVVLAGIGILASFVAFHIFRSYWRLKNFPGPFWARLTNLSRVQWVRSRRAHEIHMGLHDQYGDCVRFGPNMVSIADPEAIPLVYPMRPGFVKVRLIFIIDVNSASCFCGAGFWGCRYVLAQWQIFFISYCLLLGNEITKNIPC